MRLKIITVRDIVANVFSPPQFTQNIGGAIRGFGDQCKDKTKGNIVGEHPNDFELYELGEFDDADAKFHLLETPKQIAVGANYAD